MATVALPSVGPGQTLSLDWSRRAWSHLVMLAHRVTDRFVDWTQLEARADRLASYGALVLAALTTLAVFVGGPF